MEIEKNTLLSKLKEKIEMYTWIAMSAPADCLIFVTEERKRKKYLHRPGIEPGPPAWQASILPLNQRCSSSLMLCSSTAVVAEWLRRLTRNQFPSGSVGSNPTDCDNSFFPSPPTELSHQLGGGNTLLWCASIVGSVVECSPATRAARVRFPDDADNFLVLLQQFSHE